MNTMSLSKIVKTFSSNGLGVPIVIVMMLAMMMLPLPPFLLDILFTFNITLTLLVLLAAIYAVRPLDFAIFPTILLVATLLRLSMNIATTRVILLHGHTGTDAAGQVVKSFGEVVIGGNYAVGLVVFAILVVINFVVVTKGAGRVSEVSARFTLDAMPGKQMAIDADLNAGLVTQDEAKLRRSEVAQEADFYGAMDGASKFVRGDAIAGILILFINIVGGLIIGMGQHGMSFSNASYNYISLTIGDGLVAQIPALLLSVAAAIIVTRVSKEADISQEIATQVFSDYKALMITAAIMGLIGIIPGMPHLAFLSLSVLVGTGAYFLYQKTQEETTSASEAEACEQEKIALASPESKDLDWDDVTFVDPIGLEVGYRIIPLVDKSQGGELLTRIKGVRKKLSQQLGFLVPSVHIRDNLELAPNTYTISVAGVVIGSSEIYPEKFMAINPGQVFGELEGMNVKDPAFGLDAVWVDDQQREHAQSMGYTVVDASTVIATHVSTIVQDHAADLFGYEEAQKLLDNLAKDSPKLAQNLVPDTLPLGIVVKVLQRLLDEKISLRDFRTVASTLAEAGYTSKDPDTLTSAVRIALKRMIIQSLVGNSEDLPVITVLPDLEQLLQNSLSSMGETDAGIEPGLAEKLQQSLVDVTKQQESLGQAAVLLVQPGLRQFFARFCRHVIPSLSVLSYHEVPDDKQVKIIGTVG